jgi:large subunit ribosomal protein L19
MSKLLQEFEASQITRELPAFGPGDTVVVNVKVKEGNRERVQAYEGVVRAGKLYYLRDLEGKAARIKEDLAANAAAKAARLAAAAE